MTSQSQELFHQRMSILATYMDVIDNYDPQGESKRKTESFETINKQMWQENPSCTKINQLIRDYDQLLSYLRAVNPQRESNPEVKEKLMELTELSGSTLGHSF